MRRLSWLTLWLVTVVLGVVASICFRDELIVCLNHVKQAIREESDPSGGHSGVNPGGNSPPSEPAVDPQIESLKKRIVSAAREARALRIERDKLFRFLRKLVAEHGAEQARLAPEAVRAATSIRDLNTRLANAEGSLRELAAKLDVAECAANSLNCVELQVDGPVSSIEAEQVFDVAVVTAEHDRIAVELINARRELEKTRESLEQSDSRVAEHARELRQETERRMAGDRTAAALREDLRVSAGRLADLRDKLQTAETREREAVQARHAAAAEEGNALAQIRQRFRQSLDQVTEELDRAYASLSASNSELATLRKTHVALEGEQATLRSRLFEAEHRCISAESALARSNVARNECSQVNARLRKNSTSRRNQATPSSTPSTYRSTTRVYGRSRQSPRHAPQPARLHGTESGTLRNGVTYQVLSWRHRDAVVRLRANGITNDIRVNLNQSTRILNIATGRYSRLYLKR